VWRLLSSLILLCLPLVCWSESVDSEPSSFSDLTWSAVDKANLSPEQAQLLIPIFEGFLEGLKTSREELSRLSKDLESERRARNDQLVITVIFAGAVGLVVGAAGGVFVWVELK